MHLRETVIKEFEEELLSMSAIRDEEIFRQILESCKPIGCCIEIGTYIGLSAALLSEYATIVHTYDVCNMIQRDIIWKRFKVKNVVFHHIKNDTEKVLPSEFDFAFIDGQHNGDGPAKDFELVKRCECVLFHDYKHNIIKDDNVIKFVDSIKEGKVIINEPFALWTK